MSTSHDRSLGAFFGAAIGDAAGAILEFKKDISDEDVERAATFPGGGPHAVGPGQITDDTELALALADGLLRKPKSSVTVFPADEIANEYVKWMSSAPFDAGNTCRTAFAVSPGPGCGKKMAERALANNARSKANGALMRCVPLCIYTARSMRDTIEFAKRDAMLSHPNPTCINANIAYCAALAHLLEFPRDSAGALAKATSTSLTVPGSADDVTSWIHADVPPDATTDPGSVKHGFTQAFWHVRRGSEFDEALKDSLKRGGDTDTNAAIVGAMMGAYHGIQGIPSEYVDAVGACLNPRARPAPYRASRIPDLVVKLCS